MTYNLYKTCIQKEKQEEFLNFLASLNISSEYVRNTCLRGNCLFYEIDLSDMEDDMARDVWKILGNHIPRFLL